MRISIKPGRSRVLAIAASVLLSGAALTAATVPAQAATADVITVTPALNTPAATPTSETTDPLSTAVDLSFTATQTVPSADPLVFSSNGLPAEPPADTFVMSQPTAAGNATGDITGTFAAPFDGTLTVTATDPASGVSGTATFTWVATNDITFGAQPAAQSSVLGTAITPLTVAATDNDAAATLTYTATGLPTGLVIDATGTISGKPTKAGAYSATVTATDSAGVAAKTKPFAWTVGLEKIVVTAPAKTQVYTGVAVNIMPKATDTVASAALTWSDTGLPPGLNFSKSTGAITGRPSKAGKYLAVKLTATDATTKAAGTLTVAIVVSYPFDIFNPGTKTTMVGEGLDVAFGYTVVLKGIKVTSLSAKGLPAGMGLAANPAMLYGWATKAGTYDVVINGSGTSGATSTMTFKLVVKAVQGSDSTGQVHLALGGKCLLDPGSKTANGTKVEISNCVSGATEWWTVAGDDTLRVNGRCLDIAGTGGYSGRVAELWSCDGSAREQWAQGTDGELVNPSSGVCLTDPGSATKNAAAVQTGACRVRASEQWTLPAQAILTSLGGSCADDYHSTDTKVDMFWCNATIGQNWIFEPNGTIRPSQYPNSCVTVSGSKIVLKGCAAPTKEQKWSVSRTGGLSSEITLGGVCMATPSLTAANGTPLVTAKCTASNPNVHWHIW
jgi:hypothetical protein